MHLHPFTVAAGSAKDPLGHGAVARDKVAELLEVDETLLTAAGLPAPEGDPVVLWSPGVTVRIGRPRSVRPHR